MSSFKPDPELSDDEKERWKYLCDNRHFPEAFLLEQEMLLRKRLNILNVTMLSLNDSSTRLERLTRRLFKLTVVLVILAIAAIIEAAITFIRPI